MIELEVQPQRCLLLFIDCGEYDCAQSMQELCMLCESAGGVVVEMLVQKRDRPDKTTCVGAGKLEEVREICAGLNIDLVIVDEELSPVQLRNIQEAVECSVIDRTMLILDIFAGRAKTAEGKLQVELAQLKYRLPYLVGQGNSLSRLGGGIGTRGPGESKLESDRRHIRRRIEALEKQLRALSKRREILRAGRQENDLKTVALVGYTNVGKSTLLNRLTGAEVFAQDMLFATLDPTTRALTLQNGQTVLLTDTVGFVSRLPHQLVAAFKSTLEEAVHADLILNVCDISSPQYKSQLEVTRALLAELQCDPEKIVTIYNKCDLAVETALLFSEHGSIIVSAQSGIGLEALLETIASKVCSTVRIKLCLPYDRLDLIGVVKEQGRIVSQEYTETGVVLDAYADRKILNKLSTFICK